MFSVANSFFWHTNLLEKQAFCSAVSLVFDAFRPLKRLELAPNLSREAIALEIENRLRHQLRLKRRKSKWPGQTIRDEASNGWVCLSYPRMTINASGPSRSAFNQALEGPRELVHFQKSKAEPEIESNQVMTPVQRSYYDIESIWRLDLIHMKTTG